MIEHLASQTGILAGPDGTRSRGIFCLRCRFGVRRPFGADPVVEGRTSLANDFNDEAHRRECPHWASYLDHPEAFFSCGEDGGRTVPVPPSPTPSLQHLCESCGRSMGVNFHVFSKQVCFLCLASVARLIGGYGGLQTLIVEENADALPPPRRSRKGRGRCRKCRAYDRLVTVSGVGFCRPCATGQVEQLLGA